jgi:hypothetical protein
MNIFHFYFYFAGKRDVISYVGILQSALIASAISGGSSETKYQFYSVLSLPKLIRGLPGLPSRLIFFIPISLSLTLSL